MDRQNRKNSDESQPGRQAAIFMHYQPVTKYFVVITTKLRYANYHNSEHIISSSLNNMSSCKTEESATETQNDQCTIRYKKFSSFIRVWNHDLQIFFLYKECLSLCTRTVLLSSVEKLLCSILLFCDLKRWWINKFSKEMPQSLEI